MPGRMPARPGNWTLVASARVSARTSVGASSSRAKRSDVVERRVDVGRRRAAELGAEPERREHGCVQVLGERHLRRARRLRPRRLEADVRVDPPRARPGERRPVALEREPRGVREQMADRRSGRAGRLVEVDGALLGGDEAREGGHQLRHRGASRNVRRAVAARAETSPPAPEDGGRCVRHVPRVDLTQRLHAVDTRRVDRQLVSAVLARWPPSVGYSRAVRRRERTCQVAGTAPVMTDGGIPRPTRTARRGAASRSSSAALSELGARPEHVVRTRIYLTRAERLARGRPRARRGLRRSPSGLDDAVAAAAPRPALAGRDRGGRDRLNRGVASAWTASFRQHHEQGSWPRTAASSSTRSARAIRTRSASRRSTCSSTRPRSTSSSTSTPSWPRSRAASWSRSSGRS